MNKTKHEFNIITGKPLRHWGGREEGREAVGHMFFSPPRLPLLGFQIPVQPQPVSDHLCILTVGTSLSWALRLHSLFLWNRLCPILLCAPKAKSNAPCVVRTQ